MQTRFLVLALPLSVLVACGDKAGGNEGDDTGAGGEGVGGPGGGGSYDEGCITVDGGGGYAWLNDAITVADEGSTIELCDEAAHEEEVIVDKPVTITGPGADAFVLVAPTNTTGITITAPNVTLTGIAVQSTRSGIAVQAASGVTLDGVQVTEAGNWGLTATDATDLSVTDSTFMGNGYGGVKVDGGSATLDQLSLTQNIAYGVYATGGAQVVVSGATIDATLPTDESNATDGFGIFGDDGAAVTVSGSTLTGSTFAGIAAEEADAFVSDTTTDGGLLGLYLRLGEYSVEDVTVTGTAGYGALIVSNDPLVIDGFTTAADPDTTANLAYDDWGSSDYGVAGTGLYLASDEIDASNLAISGWNNCGLLVVPASSSGTAEVTVTNATIDNVGRYGIYSANADTTVVDSTITGMRVVDAEEDRVDPALGQDVLCYYVNYYAGVYNAEGTVDWQGGGISDGEGWGFSSIYGNLMVDGAAISSNHCSGVLGYQGTMSVSNSVLSNHSDRQVINSNSDTLVVLDGNTFSDNRNEDGFEVVYDYMDSSGYRITYTYEAGFAQVTDVVLFEVPESIIQNNTFENGDSSLVIYGGGSTISNNTWSGYRSTAIDASVNDTPADLTITDATISSGGGPVVQCNDSSLDVSDLTVSQGNHYQYAYDYTIEWSDGTSSTSTSTGTEGSIGLRASGCDIYVDTATFSELEGNAVEVYTYSGDTSSVELNDISINDVGTAADYADSAIYAYTYGGDLSLYVDTLGITQANNDHGIELYASSGTLLFDASDVTVNGAARNGIFANQASASATMTVDVDGLTIANTTEDGVSSTGATLVLANASVSSSGGNGLTLTGGDATVTDTLFDSNTGYGMECDASSTQSCLDITHTNNVEGEQSGCDAACGELAETGGDDTGI